MLTVLKYRSISSFEELQEHLSIWKKERLRFSNFFPNPDNNKKWIEQKSVFLAEVEVQVGKIGILLHFRAQVCDLFYFGTKKTVIDDILTNQVFVDWLRDNCKCPIVLEDIVRAPKYSETGVQPARILIRLSHQNCEGKTPVISADYTLCNIQLAEIDKLAIIRDILENQFSVETDRIPDMQELMYLAERGGVVGHFALCDNGELFCSGFAIYELSGKSIHLRYWWVSELMRNKRIGASLISRFFSDGRRTLSQYLWVDVNNENAIKRYNHYGFIPDGLQDFIFVIK